LPSLCREALVSKTADDKNSKKKKRPYPERIKGQAEIFTINEIHYHKQCIQIPAMRTLEKNQVTPFLCPSLVAKCGFADHA